MKLAVWPWSSLADAMNLPKLERTVTSLAISQVCRYKPARSGAHPIHPHLLEGKGPLGLEEGLAHASLMYSKVACKYASCPFSHRLINAGSLQEASSGHTRASNDFPSVIEILVKIQE